MRHYYCLLLVFYSCYITAQTTNDRYTEEEVTIEKQFIEAKKYKILGDLDAAENLLKSFLKKYRNHDVAAFELAEIYFRSEKYDDAIHYINLSIGNDPDNIWYLDLKSQILVAQKRFDQAAQVHEMITTLRPEDLGKMERKAWLYAQAGQFSRAISVIEEIEGKIGITEKTAYIKHDLYKEQGKKVKAAEVLVDLVNRNPLETEYMHVLASFYKQVGKANLAEDVYRQILTVDPDDARANVALATTLRKEGDKSGYLSSIRPIIENPEANIDVKMAELLPYVRQLQKENDDAVMSVMLDLVKLIEEAHPDDAKGYALHADLLSMAGRDAEAITYYKKTLNIDESNYLVWEQLLSLQVQSGDWEGLKQYSSEAIEIFPNQAMIYYLHSLAQINLGAYETAVDALEQGLIMVGKNEELKLNILSLLGKAYHEIADYQASTEAYDNALLIKPADGRILNDYSNCLAQRGERLSEANKMIDKALSKDRNNARFLATKGWISYRMQKLDNARGLYEQAIKNGGDHYAHILEQYGDVLYKLDHKEKALKYWQSAHELGKGSKWLARKIEEEKLIEQ